MAKKRADAELFDRLRATGLSKRVAGAVSSTRKGTAAKQVDRVIADLKALAAELEDRAKGGPTKRKAAAKKAAATRKRNAAKRSAAARKGARTRAKARS